MRRPVYLYLYHPQKKHLVEIYLRVFFVPKLAVSPFTGVTIATHFDMTARSRHRVSQDHSWINIVTFLQQLKQYMVEATAGFQLFQQIDVLDHQCKVTCSSHADS